ncbi:unnamed protein product [Pleuronectes platessa]|uniref:Uncharacterized protein n=1 Tax=Pleuronectes platessa TaxID=8262 RepID=A0A9N7TNX6_PLEPL|nr:unnamed protein product [Pleuronectes platessa]
MSTRPHVGVVEHARRWRPTHWAPVLELCKHKVLPLTFPHSAGPLGGGHNSHSTERWRQRVLGTCCQFQLARSPPPQHTRQAQDSGGEHLPGWGPIERDIGSRRRVFES